MLKVLRLLVFFKHTKPNLDFSTMQAARPGGMKLCGTKAGTAVVSFKRKRCSSFLLAAAP